MQCPPSDSSDSGDSGDFAPGPAVTLIRLSADLAKAYQADRNLALRVRGAAECLSWVTGDAVRVEDESGKELLWLWGNQP